jgi:hypothetical protein
VLAGGGLDLAGRVSNAGEGHGRALLAGATGGSGDLQLGGGRGGGRLSSEER